MKSVETIRNKLETLKMKKIDLDNKDAYLDAVEMQKQIETLQWVLE